MCMKNLAFIITDDIANDELPGGLQHLRHSEEGSIQSA